MSVSKYVPRLSCGAQVRFVGDKHHSQYDRQCTIIRALPNSSTRAEHQWYDVRFQDHSLGRFLEKYLAEVAPNHKHTAA